MRLIELILSWLLHIGNWTEFLVESWNLIISYRTINESILHVSMDTFETSNLYSQSSKHVFNFIKQFKYVWKNQCWETRIMTKSGRAPPQQTYIERELCLRIMATELSINMPMTLTFDEMTPKIIGVPFI